MKKLLFLSLLSLVAYAANDITDLSVVVEDAEKMAPDGSSLFAVVQEVKKVTCPKGVVVEYSKNYYLFQGDDGGTYHLKIGNQDTLQSVKVLEKKESFNLMFSVEKGTEASYDLQFFEQDGQIDVQKNKHIEKENVSTLFKIVNETLSVIYKNSELIK